MTETGKNYSYGSRVMSTLWNPFSYKNHEPKYPDGLAQFSIGRKYTNVTRTISKEVFIVLFPGLHTYCTVFITIPDGTGIPNAQRFRLADVHRRNDTPIEITTQVGVGNKGPEGGGTNYHCVWRTSQNFSAWRPVSQAVKIKPLNRTYGSNCGKNDGWWEAIRSSMKITPDKFGLTQRLNAPNVINPPPNIFPVFRNLSEIGDLLPTVDAAFEMQQAQNWTLQPSYTTGTINDLHKWTFQLNAIRNDNPFVDIKDVRFIYQTQLDFNDHRTAQETAVYRYPTNRSNMELNLVLYQFDVVTQDYPAFAGRQPNQKTLPMGYPNQYSEFLDIILIRLHGMESSEYLVSSVANHEYLAHETELRDYQTNSYAATRELEEYLAVRARDYMQPNHSYYNKKMKF